MPASNLAIIPKPASIQQGEGHFLLNADTVLVALGNAQTIASLLNIYLQPSTGFPLPLRSEVQDNAIILELHDSTDNPGAYGLEVSTTAIKIEAGDPAGLLYGVQTLRQLLPVSAMSDELVSDALWEIPAVSIADAPRFSWRGLHLDVARHFFDVDFIKKFIDVMAFYKFNIFHWHLTEDQGWRIEIKQYPELTTIGSNRAETPLPSNRHQGDGKPYGGFYTQDEIREVVAYATARQITVVPEIEMPGHAVAALTSYPNLGCVGEGYQVRTTWGIAKDVFCAGSEEVFTFLENVLTEVLDLFPSEFIHIGGDECPKDRWQECPGCQARIKAEGLADEHELQSYFIQRIEKWLNAHGRRLIGWDEILEGGLAPNATVMSWRGSQGGIDAANAGHDVVMSPNTHCYFDYFQSEDTDAEPSAIGGYLPVERVYMFNPIPEDIDPTKAHHILGGQGNIWTEYIPTSEQVEYMAYPRSIALSEVIWSYPEQRDFPEFRSRLNEHLKRLEIMGVNYRKLDKFIPS